MGDKNGNQLREYGQTPIAKIVQPSEVIRGQTPIAKVPPTTPPKKS